MLEAATATGLLLSPLPAIAAGEPTWNIVQASDGGTCGASVEGNVVIATPDGVRYGIIVTNVTLGDHSDRDIRIDGAPVPFKWAQLQSTVFTSLDQAGLAKLGAAHSIEFQWPERTISLPTGGLAAALPKLKACGEAIKARRIASASTTSAPAALLPPASDDGPLRLSLECDGQGTWRAGGTVSSGIPGDVIHDRDVSYPSGGQGRVRLHFGPDGDAVTFPATFPRQVRQGPIALKNVEVTPDRIIAKVRGLLGWATILTVDRRSGDVNLELGGVSFSGACRKLSEAPEARKF